MCCFSGKVEAVKNTRIFARMDENGHQTVIYSMSLKTSSDVAMVLPIPVAEEQRQTAVKFFSLRRYKDLFNDAANGFPAPIYRSEPGAKICVAVEPPGRIKVESVGAFDASYVPRIADFSRLDPRFVLSGDVWKKLPGYKDFGFAVFKLKKGDAEVHPMAFTFASAKKHGLFFPTVHIHDGKVHERAEFDHTLYCQTTAEHQRLRWEESGQLASQFLKTRRTNEMIKPDQHVYRKTMNGRLKNQDVLVALG